MRPQSADGYSVRTIHPEEADLPVRGTVKGEGGSP
jgi:hypothetical protein